MATTNILQLPVAVSTVGTEYFPVVQGGTTKRMATGLLLAANASATSQLANTALMGPTSGGTAAPAFRLLVGADLPTTFTRNSYFQSGKPWADVTAAAYAADPTGVSDCSTAFTAAIAAVTALGGGIVNVPPGAYRFTSGFTLPANVWLQGPGQNTSATLFTRADITICTVTGSKPIMTNLTLYGKGVNTDTGTFGATHNTLQVNSTNGYFQNVLVWGGYYALEMTGIDNVFIGVYASESYGPANAHITGASWFLRCSWDQNASGVSITTAVPYPAWAAGTPYTTGQTVTTAGYAIVCQTGGTSGGSAPTLKNYGIAITDGSVTWQLVAASTFMAMLVDGAAAENHFVQTDFSGQFTQSWKVNTNSAIISIVESVFSSPCLVTLAQSVALTTNELPGRLNGVNGSIAVGASFAGRFFALGNYTLGAANPCDITIPAGITDFKIDNNFLGQGTITVAVGASDYYSITNNTRATVVDGGTGTHKTVITEADANFLPVSTTTPILYGGTAVGSSLIMKATSNVAPSGDYTEIWGSTITLRTKSGSVSNVLIGVSGVTGGRQTMAGSTSGSQTWQPAAIASGTITWPAGIVDFSATGGAGQVVKQSTSGGIFTVGTITDAGITVGTSAIASGTTTRILYDNAGVLGEYTITGSGTVVAMQNTPTLTTPVIGAATGTSAALTNQIWSGSVSTALSTLTGAVDGLRASAANVTQLGAENTTASSATQGGFVGMYCNDGAAMASGDRLGGIRAGGSSSASAMRNAALIGAFADQAWVDASAYGTRWEFQTTTNGATSASTKMILGNAGVLSFGATAANTVPGLKPSSAILQARLGDDSAYCAFEALTLAASSSIKSSSPSAGVGYATGAGSTITQITNRATAVTINAVCGAITLVSAAGSATPSSFSVANSSVAATDTPYVCQKSGTDRYEIFVTNIQAGQFDITSFTTGGTTTEQPVFNFTVIKAVTS